MSIFLILILLCVSEGVKLPKAKHSRLVPRYEYMQDCPHQNFSGIHINSPAKFDFISSTGEYGVSLTIDVTRLIHPLTLSVIRIQNCNDASFARCQLFQTWRFDKNSCSMMESKTQFWSPFFRKITPDFHCPIAPGHYELKNGTFDMTVLQKLPFPLEKFFWKVQIDSYDPKYFSCLDAAVRFLRIRSS